MAPVSISANTNLPIFFYVLLNFTSLNSDYIIRKSHKNNCPFIIPCCLSLILVHIGFYVRGSSNKLSFPQK